MLNEISINRPSITQLRKMKLGLEIRIKPGNDIILKCMNDELYANIKTMFDVGKTYMIKYDVETNNILINSQICQYSDTEQRLVHTAKRMDDSQGDKDTVEKIIEIIHTITSLDEYINFSNTLIDNEDKFTDNGIKSVIMTLRTLKSNVPYMISYNQYHMISVEIINNLKTII